MESIQLPNKYAIFQTGGKQYQAIEGKTVAIEKIAGQAGDKVEFADVLMRKQGESAEFGHPYLSQPIKASIVKQMRGPKLTIFHFKRRKKVRSKRGHRQPITVIRVESI